MPAITDYTSLVAACADQVTRDDLDWALFVQSAHIRILRELPEVFDVVSATLTASGERVALPSGFCALVSAKTDQGGALSLTSPEIRQANSIAYSAGLPRWASIEANEIVFAPVPATSTAVRIVYRAVPTLPSAATPTNDVLTAHPFVYLYGALCEAARKLQDEALEAKYEALFQRETDEIHLAEQARTYGGTVPAPLSVFGASPP
jgi:hypothetical protein